MLQVLNPEKGFGDSHKTNIEINKKGIDNK